MLLQIGGKRVPSRAGSRLDLPSSRSKERDDHDGGKDLVSHRSVSSFHGKRGSPKNLDKKSLFIPVNSIENSKSNIRHEDYDLDVPPTFEIDTIMDKVEILIETLRKECFAKFAG